MTTAEWTADAINMLLVLLIVCVFVLGIIAAKGFVGERMLRKRSIWFASVLGFFFMAYLVLHVLADLNLLADWDALSGLREILPANWAQIFLVLGLVTVTGFYVLMAFRQAKASVKMAEEMRDARYDALRPIIDIVEQTVEPREMATRAYTAREGIFPKKLSCLIRNIGVGPAIEVYSFIEDARGETCRWDYGSIPVAIGEEEMGYRREMPLSLQQRGEHKALVVCYKDVYGNLFESSRVVTVDEEKQAVNIGPLKIRPVPKKEHTDD